MNANRHTKTDRSVLTVNQKWYRDFVLRNPGCSIADVARTMSKPGVRFRDYGFSAYVYDRVKALVKRGVLTVGAPRPSSAGRGAKGLYVVVP